MLFIPTAKGECLCQEPDKRHAVMKILIFLQKLLLSFTYYKPIQVMDINRTGDLVLKENGRHVLNF